MQLQKTKASYNDLLAMRMPSLPRPAATKGL